VFPVHRKNTHDLIPFASPLLSILLFANITARVGRTASLYHVIVKEEVNAFLRACVRRPDQRRRDAGRIKGAGCPLTAVR
jgi:hypothetical protein